MFSSIVVPLDLGETGDRALPIVRSLAQAGGLPIELLTITSPRMVGLQDAFELDRRVKVHGIGPHSIHVLYDDDAGRAITSHVAEREDALVVMASTAKGVFAERMLGSVSEHVLAHAHRPVLVVGPHVDVSGWAGAPTLVVGVDDSVSAEAAVPVIATWERTFGGAVHLVEVAPRPVAVGGGWGDEAATAIDQIARRLADHGVDVSGQMVPGGGAPATRLEEFASDLGNAVFVATSSNWTSAKPHWHSTTRTLARRSRRPVLVVPAG